jgi:SulP family sulfate permease
LGECLAEGYTRAKAHADLMAGLTVGIIGLPLSMALAIACGVPPQNGLYTAIVGGAVIALLGGSRLSVSGPTAAFVVVLAPIAAKYGLGGLLVATFMAGIFLVIMGLARLGRLIQFIPYPVTTGFTTGIAVVIVSLQVKDFLGLRVELSAENFIDRVAVLAASLPTVRWLEFAVGAVSLAVLILWPRLTRAVPGALVVSVLGCLAAWLLHRHGGGLEIDTVGGRFSFEQDGVVHRGVPPFPPAFRPPWLQPNAAGEPVGLTWEMVRDLSSAALAIAMLGAIESLLCAVVADGLAGTRHDPDAELIGQGVGNMIGPFFGGFAATAAIARTSANVRAGGRTPLSAVVHCAFLLAAIVVLAPLLSWLPMATMAALLLIVAWNMSDIKHFVHLLKVAPRSDLLVLLTCFSLTVVIDMAVAVSVGVVLAALLFMQRMSALTETRFLTEEHTLGVGPPPPGVLVYEIAGSLFFGATERAMSVFRTTNYAKRPRAIILVMNAVPMMDVTGLVALESILEKLRRMKIMVILSGLQDQPAELLERGGIKPIPGKFAICYDLEQAYMLASLGGQFTMTQLEVPKLK